MRVQILSPRLSEREARKSDRRSPMQVALFHPWLLLVFAKRETDAADKIKDKKAQELFFIFLALYSAHPHMKPQRRGDERSDSQEAETK